jgi:anti-sigma factor RsiW
MSAQQGLHGPWRWNDPAQEAARQAQHALLIDLLGAYVDEELPPETASQLDAHLVGCARCRREVQLQLSLRDTLAATPVVPARPALRERILAATATLPPPGHDERRALPSVPDAPAPRRGLRWLLVSLLVALTLAGGVALWRVVGTGHDGGLALAPLATSSQNVPLLAAAADDYRRLRNADLPGPARDLEAVRAAVGLPVQPLSGPGVRLLGAWTSAIAGEPAAVLAYRWDDRLVVQYIVPDQLFFRHPALRAAAASHHAVGTTDGTLGIVAWPTAAAGSVLVGDGAPERLAGALAR